MADKHRAQTDLETETTAPEHEVGTPRCAVCGKDTRQPITVRLWDDLIDEELEAEVCSGDCAKAWIDDIAETHAEVEADVAALARDVAAQPLGAADSAALGYGYPVEVEPGKIIRVRVKSDVDPATDPDLAAEVEARTKVEYARYQATLARKQTEQNTKEPEARS